MLGLRLKLSQVHRLRIRQGEVKLRGKLEALIRVGQAHIDHVTTGVQSQPAEVVPRGGPLTGAPCAWTSTITGPG